MLLLGVPSRAADPDFTHVDDILGGFRSLMPVDDLYLVRSSPVRGTRLFTTQLSITSSTDATPIENASGIAAVLGARVFDLGYDVAVRAWPDKGNHLLNYS